ncbi:hypothetical protein RB623_01110 [Mesorhizobium sp. LHD-90]|uniref:hypothetical protein n=1 Tax=Mesorhizobium sp. LHD-90 TaxID=3071414 RepID=UPI0027DF7970|nr:hypothetical protein [Mesorhizobium sp. LHD-90]MDQ6432649.1 hypothetical protein [Mesorhizobium sp. LHD-90]
MAAFDPVADVSHNVHNWEHVGLDIGKVFQINDKVTANAFIEPQYTVWSEGAGNPGWQIFAGINFQFALGK